MFAIPRKDLIILLNHITHEDLFLTDIEQIFKQYGDKWFIEGCEIKLWEVNKEREEFIKLSKKGGSL